MQNFVVAGNNLNEKSFHSVFAVSADGVRDDVHFGSFAQFNRKFEIRSALPLVEDAVRENCKLRRCCTTLISFVSTLPFKPVKR